MNWELSENIFNQIIFTLSYSVLQRNRTMLYCMASGGPTLQRILEGDTRSPERVRAQTALMREGLDHHPQASYFIHEEEVPRAGVKISQAFQSTCWSDGQVSFRLNCSR